MSWTELNALLKFEILATRNLKRLTAVCGLGFAVSLMLKVSNVLGKTNLEPRSHSDLRWNVRSPFRLAVGDLGSRLRKNNLRGYSVTINSNAKLFRFVGFSLQSCTIGYFDLFFVSPEGSKWRECHFYVFIFPLWTEPLLELGSKA